MTPPPFPEAAIAAVRDAAKAYLRIATASEDALIERLAGAALAIGEAFTGTAWIARDDWIDTMPASRAWQRLGAAPVSAITAVETLSVDGEAVAIAAEDYAIDLDAEGQGWVRVMATGLARVRVTFGAGAAAEWGDLPPPLAQGAVLLTAHLFEHRESDEAPPAAVSALWRPFRRMRVDAAVHA